MLSKPLQAAMIFGIVIVSFAALLGQAGNFFSKAQGAQKITGTIVLVDDFKFVTDGGAKFGQTFVKSTVALPGTSCSVMVAGCCANFGGGASFNTSLYIGSNNFPGTLGQLCNSGNATLAGSSTYEVGMNCASIDAISNLSVSYSCTI